MNWNNYVILILCGSVHSAKIKETWPAISSVLKENTRNEVRVCLTVNVIGLILCGKICSQYQDCEAVNFNKERLICELVGTGTKDSELISALGWQYMFKTDLQQMYNDQDSSYCGTANRHVRLSSGQSQCLNDTELTYKDCRYTPSPGVYRIQISTPSLIKAMCLSGGWMVFQHKKLASSENFHRLWSDYKNGFGKPDREHWLGNEHVYQYTSQGHTQLRIELNNDSGLYAEYDLFKLSDETDKYRMSVSGYTGTAGNSLQYSNSFGSDGKKFTTIDSDNDISPENCAATDTHGAWWLGRCTASSLNGSKVKWMLQSRSESRVMIRRKQ